MMELIQPQIVKFNSNESLPEYIREKYFVYYVISGLFDSNNSIHAIYVDLNSVDKLHTFISNIQKTDISLLFTGDSNFVLGQDYYLNESLYNSMEQVELVYLPDYMTIDGYNSDMFDYLDNYSALFEYFVKKNKYLKFTFDEAFLKEFYVSFATLILELNVYTPSENIDYIYKQVLDYFANYQSDDVYLGMSLIFNTLYSTVTNTNVNCGCNTGTNNNNNVCTTSCKDYYKNAMSEYIKSMFGDYTFYQKWFFITDEDTGAKQVNQLMVDKLRLFITEFLALGISLNTNTSSNNNCMCPTIDTSSDECNRGIVTNFLTILDYIEQNKIEENSNRIKVYGETFGNLFPKLLF